MMARPKARNIQATGQTAEANREFKMGVDLQHSQKPAAQGK